MRVLIVPAAGEGSRFRAAGYKVPKPFIELSNGLRMVEAAMAPFQDHVDATIAIFKQEHSRYYITESCPYSIKSISHPTEGAALTILAGVIGQVPLDAEVIVINSDQLFEAEAIERWIKHIELEKPLGSVLCFNPEEPGDARWSYVQLARDDDDLVMEPLDIAWIEEKQPNLLNIATCGAYYFRSAQLLIQAVARMVAFDERYNGEFYFAPCYGYLGNGDEEGSDRISPYMISNDEFTSLGTPELLQAWEASHGVRAEA